MILYSHFLVGQTIFRFGTNRFQDKCVELHSTFSIHQQLLQLEMEIHLLTCWYKIAFWTLISLPEKRSHSITESPWYLCRRLLALACHHCHGSWGDRERVGNIIIRWNQHAKKKMPFNTVQRRRGPDNPKASWSIKHKPSSEGIHFWCIKKISLNFCRTNSVSCRCGSFNFQ